MSSPATGTALLLLAVFVLPGFVAILVKERIYEVPSEQQAFERLLQTLYYSLLVYAVPVALALLLGLDQAEFEQFARGDSDLRLTAAAAVGILLVLPLGIAYAGRRWLISKSRPWVLERLRISTTHRTASSWDFAFEDGEPYLMVARLKDGTVVGGYYGPESHSGYGTRDRDLFLEERWTVKSDENGQVIALDRIENSLGVWLAPDEIVSLARYAVDDAQVEELRNQ